MSFTAQNFVNQQGPAVSASWLNGVDVFCNSVFAGAQTLAAAQAAIGVPNATDPLTTGAGGTGVSANNLTSLQIALGITTDGNMATAGAVAGVDCTAILTATAAANKLVTFPAGAWVISSTPTIPTDVVIRALPGSSFSGAGSAALDLNIFSSYQYNVVEGDVVGAGFRNVHSTAHTYGGASMTGGRNSFAVQSSLNTTSSASNANRNYVAGLFEFNGNVNDNGTNPTAAGTSAGAGFGLNPVAILGSGATSWLNLSGMEVNVACQTGSSVYARTGIQIAELVSSAVQGAIFDGALTLSNQGGVGWQNGILFCALSGTHPCTSTGSLITTQGAHTQANGVNLTSYTFTGQSFAATGFAVQGGGTEIDLGIGSGFHQTLHHTSGATYDTRIVSQSGTGITGAGTMLLNAGALGFFAAATGGAQATGYGTPTGGAHQTSFAAGTITLPNLAAAVAQLILDLKSYSLIGA